MPRANRDHRLSALEAGMIRTVSDEELEAMIAAGRATRVGASTEPLAPSDWLDGLSDQQLREIIGRALIVQTCGKSSYASFMRLD
jgi:hypothetical protein